MDHLCSSSSGRCCANNSVSFGSCCCLQLVKFSQLCNLFQTSNIALALLGLIAGGVLAYFAGRYFEPFVIEILNKRTRIAGLKDTLTDIRHIQKELQGTVPIQFEKQFTAAELKNGNVSGRRYCWQSCNS